jgi:orotidine-5'-phosphate decarboxylase
VAATVEAATVEAAGSRRLPNANPGRPPHMNGGERVHFADRLAALVDERRSQVVLGLDPDPADLWPAAVEHGRERAQSWEDAIDAAARERGIDRKGYEQRLEEQPGTNVGASAAAEAVRQHCTLAIEAVAPACVAAKLQLACFERLGPYGGLTLWAVAMAARAKGLLVIADGKRGDVPVTAHAYAQALVGETESPFGPIPGLGADAFTANPLLGRDSLGPLVDAAARAGAGCFLLVRTSNEGAAEIQDAVGPEGPLHEWLARIVNELGTEHLGARSLSAVGAVVGATRPDLLTRFRELMPRAIFLVPGVGAQGGDVASLAPAFEPGPAAGLITASRSIVDAHRELGGDPAAAAAAAAEELREAAWSIAGGPSG